MASGVRDIMFICHKEGYQMEIHNDKGLKVIAFYLPQFHSIPENDMAYGKGFTEWTNTKKAKPLFEGHYQPRIPFEHEYYDLNDISVMKKQADVAKQYGIYGFCFYHYWFQDGKKLLEKPVEQFLKHTDIDIPFCLSWANENWTKKWDGGQGEIIARQKYGNEINWRMHMEYLSTFFQDPRYMTIDGRPVLLIYRPDLIPHVDKMMEFFRRAATKMGFKGLCLMSQHPTYLIEGENKNIFDNYVEFEPAFINKLSSHKRVHTLRRKIERIVLNTMGDDTVSKIKKVARTNRVSKLEKRSYVSDWNSIINMPFICQKQIAGAFVDWDNTPRNKNGLLYIGSSPTLFKHFFEKLCLKVISFYNEPIIFINAWNEWAEGAYLEPDEKYGFAYLEAVKEVLENVTKGRE